MAGSEPDQAPAACPETARSTAPEQAAERSFAEVTLRPIGVVRSVFHDKFGVPRQSGLVPSAWGRLELTADFRLQVASLGLEQFSHLWVIFLFHQTQAQNWRPSVRPPRLGGAKKMGVLASRSPHRPNPLGLSVVQLQRVERLPDFSTRLHVKGLDLLDGTPILDVKPYLAYADCLPQAHSGWAGEEIQKVPVTFLPSVAAELTVELRTLITEILTLDPRPAFQKRKLRLGSEAAQGTQYGFKLAGFNVRWVIDGEAFLVMALEKLERGQWVVGAVS